MHLYAKIEFNWSRTIYINYLSNGKFLELFEKIYEPVIIDSIDDIDEYEKHGTLAESLTHYIIYRDANS